LFRAIHVLLVVARQMTTNKDALTMNVMAMVRFVEEAAAF
jgi:hypothetical protein